jgi:CRP-like cAMP-binding protein
MSERRDKKSKTVLSGRHGWVTMARRLRRVLEAMLCLTGAAAGFIAAGDFAGIVGVIITGVLVLAGILIAIPLVGFTCSQVNLANKGREVATTAAEVRTLQEGSAAAFTQPFAAVFRMLPQVEIYPGRPFTRRSHAAEIKGNDPEAIAPASLLTVEGGEAPVKVSAAHQRQTALSGDHGRLSRNATTPSKQEAGNPREPRPFWNFLNQIEREAIKTSAREKTFASGASLCREGHAADHVFVIQSGSARVCVTRGGKQQTIAHRGPGDLIGERAALRVSSRSASVIALDPVQALLIRTRDFAAFLEAHPRVLTLVEQLVYDRLTEDRASSDTLSPAWTGQNCSILFTDISAFGSPGRDDVDRRIIRRVMYDILQGAFERSEISWRACHRDDRGDGALIIIPPDIATKSVVDPLLLHVAARLKHHNHYASEAIRVQLRVALHVGPVVSDAEGVSGEAIILAARLMDAPTFKEQLAASAVDLGIIVSNFVYETVIKHGRGFINPADYSQVEMQVKESKFTAWIHLLDDSDAV